jgi:hypothetical protein
LLPSPPLRRKKGNRYRIHRRGGSAAGGEGEGALPSGEEGHHGCHWNGAGSRDRRRDGEQHISTATAGYGPSTSVACGGENFILPSG